MYKELLIEDKEGVKYYPITKSKSIKDLKENVVISVNNKKGNVLLTSKDITIDDNNFNTVYDMMSTLPTLFSDLDNKKADKDNVVTSINNKSGSVTLEGKDIIYKYGTSLNSKIDSLENQLDYNTSSILDKVDEDEVRSMIKNVPVMFHSKISGLVTEDKNPSWFEKGVTVCNHGNRGHFPSINEFGISITFIGEHDNFGQIFITADGDLWQRRSNSTASWRSWGSGSKKEENIKVVTGKTIYSSNWSYSSGRYRAKVSDSFVTSSSIVDVNIHLSDLDKASGVLPVTQSYSGYFYLYADDKPSSYIDIDYKVIKN